MAQGKPTRRHPLRQTGLQLPRLRQPRHHPSLPPPPHAGRSVRQNLGPSPKRFEPDPSSPATTTNLVARAHARRLLVVPYTFKNEPEAIRRLFTTHGIDGVFADYPDVAIRARGE
ncbi:MAG: hypothetical protein K2Q20_12170 [Phycisphaerales bacterium]|nr:hypothetical protein [Phycisphaerales bacterium]